MSMPTIPLSTTLLVVIALLSAVPGLFFPPRAGKSGSRPIRLAAASILGSLAGWLLGSAVLASELPVPTTVLVLLVGTVVFAEGLAGRGWPLAGSLSATVLLTAVVLDLLDRTGERMSWMLWPILVAIAIASANLAQFAWRGLWNLLSRPSRTGSSSHSGSDHSS